MYCINCNEKLNAENCSHLDFTINLNDNINENDIYVTNAIKQ